MLCKLGESIVSQRGLADRIHCINKASYDLTLGPGKKPLLLMSGYGSPKVPDVYETLLCDGWCLGGDLPDRVDIIVTELVDSGI